MSPDHHARTSLVYRERAGCQPLPIAPTPSVDGDHVASGTTAISAPPLSTANRRLDIGLCLGSPGSLDYRERTSFQFNGTISRMHVVHG